MNRHQIYSVVAYFVALIAFVNVANAQSKNRDNPTKLTSNVISGFVDSESRGNWYYYSFIANPGEVSITLTVEPGRNGSNSDLSFTRVEFSLFDQDANEVASKGISAAQIRGSEQAIARIEVKRRQLMVLGVNIPSGPHYHSVGGKYRIRIDGSVDLSPDKRNSVSDSMADFKKELSLGKSSDFGCLPKQGTLIIKMKDGSKKIIDLGEAETVTVVP